MELSEIKTIYDNIEQDFDLNEYPPYNILYKQIQKGLLEGHVLESSGNIIAYSICGASNKNEYVLLSLLAVFPQYRGKGIGTAFLKGLRKKYSHKKAIIVEIERFELAKTQEEKNKRLRRIEFYRKEDFSPIMGIDYYIWDLPMAILALPINVPIDIIQKEIKEVLGDIYLDLIGPKLIHKMVFK
jgi:GNAT superfamily N-acetyltransferase